MNPEQRTKIKFLAKLNNRDSCHAERSVWGAENENENSKLSCFFRWVSNCCKVHSITLWIRSKGLRSSSWLNWITETLAMLKEVYGEQKMSCAYVWVAQAVQWGEGLVDIGQLKELGHHLCTHFPHPHIFHQEGPHRLFMLSQFLIPSYCQHVIHPYGRQGRWWWRLWVIHRS